MKMMIGAFAFIVCLACGAMPMVQQSKFESIPGGEVRVESFLTDAIDGIYGTNGTIRFRLRGYAEQAVVVSIRAVDFFGRTVELGISSREVARGVFNIALDARTPPAPGHYTVIAAFVADGKALGRTQTAFVVAPERPERADPFYVVDKNCAVTPLTEAMRDLGFGAFFQPMNGVDWAITTTPEEREKYYATLSAGNRKGNLAVKGLSFVGSASPDVKRSRKVQERLQKGLSPLSDNDLMLAREHGRRLAAALADIIDTWIVQEEFDAISDIPDCRDDIVHHISTHALITENLLIGLRGGNPKCRVGVLGICCNDYLCAPPPWRLSRMVLGAICGQYDFIALDAYTGGWNATQTGVYFPPENLLRKMLLDAADLSAEYGGFRQVWNAERCHALDYAAAFDSHVCRQQAVMTARSMIINRAVDKALSYTLHVPTYPSRADQFLSNQETYINPSNRLYDVGIWKTVRETRGGRACYVPRPAVAAAGTVARELAFVRDPLDLPLRNGAYACLFTREDGHPVAALWSTNTVGNAEAERVLAGEIHMGDGNAYGKLGVQMAKGDALVLTKVKRVSMALPSGGVKTDLMGNATPFGGGDLVLTLDEAPVFIRGNGSREELLLALMSVR